MEPVTTTALIATVVGYLAKTLKDNKAFKDFTTDFSGAAINWIRPIFLKEDGEEKEVLQDLKKNPADELNLQDTETAIAKALRNEPDGEKWLREMAETIKAKKDRGEKVSIRIEDSKNVVAGSKVDTGGGDFIVGDRKNIDK